MKRIVKLILIIILIGMTAVSTTFSYDILAEYPMATQDQVYQCAKDRNASQEFLDIIPFVYEYSQQLGVDPTIVLAISCLETGYGKSNLFRNYNNPGGIKGKNGWRKFDTLEDGYKCMINLLAIYAGVIGEDRWQYNKAHTTEELGNYYWVENGCDRGYHNKLTIMIRTMVSYPKKEETKPKTKPKTKKVEKPIEENKNTKPSDIIYNILNKESKDNKGLRIINDILKGGE